MKKHLFFKTLLIAIGLLVTGLTTQVRAGDNCTLGNDMTNVTVPGSWNSWSTTDWVLTKVSGNEFYGVLYVPASTTTTTEYEFKLYVSYDSGKSYAYKSSSHNPGSGNKFTSSQTALKYWCSDPGNVKVEVMSSPTGFVKLDLRLWGKYDEGGETTSRVYIGQTAVSALGLTSISASPSTVASAGTSTLSYSGASGGSGSYSISYSATSGSCAGSTFTAPYVFSPTNITITGTLTDANSQLSGLASAQRTTTVTVNRPDNMYIKTQFNDFDNWGWVTLPSNGDGTYSVTAKYKGSTGCNWHVINEEDEYQYIAPGDYTLVHDAVNDPLSDGDDCTFKLTPTSWTDDSKAASVTITKRIAVTATKVALDGGTGSASAPSISAASYANGKVDYNTSVTFTASTEAAGYSWKGWYTNSTGTGVAYNTNKSFTETVTSAKTYYAIYEPITYTGGTLDKKEGSADGSYSVTYNTTSFASKSAPTRTGYNVEGYYKETDRTTKVANADGSLNPNKTYTDGSSRWIYTSSIPTLYTKWTAKTYTVTLDDNGGSTDGSATATYDANTLSSITAPTRTGYHVEGYYNDDDLTNKVATDGGALQSNVIGFTTGTAWTKDGNATLYTKWTANTWYVRFNKNDDGATGTMSDESFTYDAPAKALTACGFTKTGWDFVGWAESPSGTALHDDEATVRNLTPTKDGIVTLYAKWERHVYTINLNNDYTEGNGSPGTHLDDVDPLTYKVTYGTNSFDYVMNDAPSHWPYTFMGYWTAVGGGGTQIINDLGQLQASTPYTDGSGNWTNTSDVTVYAKWMVDQTLSKNAASNATNGAITLTYNSSAVSGYTASTRKGYSLDGYFTAASSGSEVITNAGAIKSGDVDGYVDDGKWIYEGVSAPSIYAQWTPITYTIQFAKNTDASYLGSETGDDPDEITGATYDAEVTLPACPYTRTGYTFIGWAKADKKAKGSVNASLNLDYQYASGTHNYNISATQDSVAILYPKWLGNSYTVSFNARGGTCYTSSKDVRVGEVYGSLPTAYPKTGYEFVGWFTMPNGGSEVTAEDVMTSTTAHTLYAHYVKKSYVYFKNTLGWENVYVTYAAYWSNDLGTGNNGKTYHKMSRVPGTTDIYYDEVPASIVDDWQNEIAFNNTSLSGHNPEDFTIDGACNNFNSGEAVYRIDFDSIASMFVPTNVKTNNTEGNYTKNSTQYRSTGYADGTSSDPQYTSGYWRVYNDEFSGYTITWQKNDAGSWNSAKDFNAAKAGDSVFVYTITMEANTQYNYNIIKKYKHSGKSDEFKIDEQINSGHCANLKLLCKPGNGYMQTTVAGDYTFKLTLKSDGHIYLSVEYPFAVNDYRVVYDWNDGSAHSYVSEIIKHAAGTNDTVSVFVHKSGSPIVSRSLKIQKCTAINGSGVPTWTDVTGGNITLSDDDIKKNGVYNFVVAQPESGDPTGAFVEKYEGDYYIRTATADGGWDQYKYREDNQMTYSAYSMTQMLSDPYSHYYCRFIGSTSADITYAIATKYSPNISGIMTGDATIGNAATTLPAAANVRFSWNEETNAMGRAYIKPAQGGDYDNSRFLVLHGKSSDMIFNPDSSAITASSPLAADELQFDDMGDWVYQVILTAKPNAAVSLIANYNSADRYLIGGASSWETIFGGEGSAKYTIVAIYDFKTNRLMNAWTPDGAIKDELSDIDMLWIRRKDDAAQQITFSGSGSLSDVKVVGAIELRYNDLVGKVASWSYDTRKYLKYFISFPFDVNVSDVFGLNGAILGRDYVIQKYNGDERAKNGLFLGDGDTYWENLTMDSVMHANEGYSLIFDNEYLNGDLGTIWENKSGGSSVYLYFPAKAKIASISDDDAGTSLPGHLCKDTRTYTYGGGSISHANSDSHWNLIGSPLFHNSYVTESEGTNGQAGALEKTTLDSYYAYDASTNLWIPTLYYSEATGKYYECKAMHAMLVQFTGSVTWSVDEPDAPAAVIARQRQETTNKLITLNLLQGEEECDHTFIRMHEDGNADFVLCEDMFKIINKKLSNIFSYAGSNCVAYNKIPVESTTINLGVEIRKNGTYTFSMPENVAGQITLIDNFAQTRTNLNIEDYVVDLNKGNYYDRFSIEINVNNAPTAIDGVTDGSGSLKDGEAHKFIMNDQMYILKNGIIYDARGNRVQ